MTKSQDIKNTVRPLRIPTREEFHREFAGVIKINDFCTESPNPCRLNHLTLAEKENRKKTYQGQDNN